MMDIVIYREYHNIERQHGKTWNMIVMTVFLLILNQTEFHLNKNRKENCHHDHIALNLK